MTRKNTRILFDFYGITFELNGYSKVVNNLKKDFQYFLSNKSSKKIVNLNIYFQKPNKINRTFWYKRKDYVVNFQRNSLSVYYNGELLVMYDYKNQSANFYSEDFNLLYEISYLFIHSVLSQLIELKNICRIHALGFSYNKNGYLFLAPMNGGKSSFSLELLKDSRFKILSDDIPFITNDLQMLPFPIRIGVKGDFDTSGFSKVRILKRREFGKKKLIDTHNFEKNIGKRLKINTVFIGNKSKNKLPSIRKANFFQSFKCLFINLVIGYGTPQVVEFLIKPSITDILKKIFMIGKRFLLALKLLNKCDFYFFFTVKNFGKNKELLEEFLNS